MHGTNPYLFCYTGTDSLSLLSSRYSGRHWDSYFPTTTKFIVVNHMVESPNV